MVSVLLLMRSGDVELNPGPIISDKPTREELIKILSSKLSVAWEDFVCCLPGMTQEIVTNISQRQSEDSVNATLLQWWLDSTPNATWRHVVNALLEANEPVLAQHVLASLVETTEERRHENETTNIGRTMRKVLTTHYSQLHDATELCIEKLAAELYSKDLVSLEVRKSPTYAKIEAQFVSVMPCKRNIDELKQHCQLFLNCLYIVEGPVRQTAKSLAQMWEQEVLKKHGIHLSLVKKPQTKTSTSLNIELSSKDQVAKDLESLHERFVSLLTNIRDYYDECKQYKVINMARWLSEYFEETGLTQVDTIDNLFDKIRPHYHFLNCELIQDLVKKFPLNDRLQSELDEYVTHLNTFEDSSQLQHMKTAIEEALIPRQESSEMMCEVYIKLTGKWKQMTKKNLQKLMSHLFGEKAKFLNISGIQGGSVIVRFTVPRSHAPAFIAMAKVKAPFVHHLGIFQMMIGNQCIVEKEEDVNFTFEQSLLDSIKNIGIHEEYKKAAFFLMDLGIDLNYENEDGVTALKLASDGGQIEVFMFLLQSTADPTVQQGNRSNNSLYSLACTALCQHMNTSASVRGSIEVTTEDIEKLAFGTAVNPLLIQYGTFISLVFAKLQKRFQRLQEQFGCLDATMSSTVNELVTMNIISLANIKRHLQLYIEQEPSKCSSVHQLISLLRQHYSCFNVNIFDCIGRAFQLIELQSQVESYMAILKIFENTTQLFELKIAMTQTLPSVNESGCVLVMKLYHQWGYKTLAELHKAESLFFSTVSPFLNLKIIYQEKSTLACVYTVPHSRFTNLVANAASNQSLMTNCGVCEVVINNQLIFTQDKNREFNFENALKKAIDASNAEIISFLVDINVTLSTADDNSTALATTANADSTVMATRENDLFDAFSQNNTVLLESLLKQEVDVTCCNENGATLLMLASSHGYYQIAELLLVKGADINTQSVDGLTALMLACNKGHNDILELLLTKNPDVNIQNNDGETALMIACYNGHFSTVELLLTSEPNINIQNNDGVTALMLSSLNGHQQAVQLLLSRNPDVNVQSDDGLTALMLASLNGHHEVIKLLLDKNADFDIGDSNGVTALMLSSLNGHHDVVQLLLTNGADLDIQSNDGATALMAASCNGLGHVVELLLTRNPNIDLQSNDGVTALMLACLHGHHDIVEILLTKEPNVNIQDCNGVTALMASCYKGYQKIVQLLVAKEANVDIQENNGVTALVFAAFKGHLHILELLLTQKPNVNLTDNNGVTALMLASQNEHCHVVDLLLQQEPDINIRNKDGVTALMLASYNGHDEIVKLLLNKGADINIQSNDGWTALMLAACDGHQTVIQLLLKQQPDVSIQNNDGMTAIMITLLFTTSFLKYAQADSSLIRQADQYQSKYLNIFRCLLDAHGTNLSKNMLIILAALSDNHKAMEIILNKGDISSEDIKTAFIMACCFGHSSVIISLSDRLPSSSTDERELLVATAKGDIGMLVSKLFEAGMNPDTLLAGGLTPLMIAASCGHIETVDVLLQAGADINKSCEGYTALDIVSVIKGITENDHDHNDIIDLLIQNGANATTTQSDMNTESSDTVPCSAPEQPADGKVLKLMMHLAQSLKQMALHPLRSFHNISSRNDDVSQSDYHMRKPKERLYDIPNLLTQHSPIMY